MGAKAFSYKLSLAHKRAICLRQSSFVQLALRKNSPVLRATLERFCSFVPRSILATNKLFLTVCARRKYFAYDKSQQRMRFHPHTVRKCSFVAKSSDTIDICRGTNEQNLSKVARTREVFA